MIQGVSSGGQVGIVAITAMRYAQSDGGTVVVPVRPAQMINASFKHIQMRPDSRLQDGVPLYKLKILDSLIDHMAKATPNGAGLVGKSGVDAVTIDGLIATMSGSARAEAGTAAAYRAGFFLEPGALVDLVA
jgi:hypothetical protein